MSSVFPGALDSLSTSHANGQTIEADTTNELADAVNALERTHGAEVFSVTNYGAVGNGSTDDTAEIQAAIDAAEAYTIATMRNATVYFPAGTYQVSSTLYVTADNITLQGIGRRGVGYGTTSTESTVPVTGGSIIRPTNAFTGDWVIDISDGQSPKVRALCGCWVKGLSIEGYYIPAGITGGINFMVFRGGITDSHINRLKQNGATGPGIEFRCVDDINDWARGAWDCMFANNVIDKCGGPCFYAPGQASDSALIGNFIGWCETDAVHLVGPGFVVVGNYIYNNEGLGLLAETRQYIITGNRFRECAGGIKIAVDATAAGGFVISGNSFRSCSQDGDNVNDVIEIAPTAATQGGTITGNQFEAMINNDGNTYRPRYLINIANSNAVEVEIGPYGAGYASPASAPFATAAINDSGTRTRFVTGRRITLPTSDSFVSLGVNPASTGLLRLPNNSPIVARNAANSADVNVISLNASNRIGLGTEVASFTMGDGANISTGTTTGSSIGGGVGQKIGFHGAAPVAQQAGTTDLRQLLINYGLLASGGATPLNLNGGALTAASSTLSGTLTAGSVSSGTITLSDGANVVVGTGTGTKIATATSQKLGFYNATPIVQPSSTTDLRQALIDLGLYATGGATPLNLNGGAFTAASSTLNGTVTTGLTLSGTFSSYGIDFNSGTFTTASIRLKNNSPIMARNAAGSADVSIVSLNASDRISFGTTVGSFNLGGGGSINFGEGANIVAGTGTGTKIGTSASEKIGFHGATAVIQHSATGETVGFTAGAGTNVTDASTFTGNVGSTAYRISDIVKALKNKGLMAS